MRHPSFSERGVRAGTGDEARASEPGQATVQDRPLSLGRHAAHRARCAPDLLLVDDELPEIHAVALAGAGEPLEQALCGTVSSRAIWVAGPFFDP